MCICLSVCLLPLFHPRFLLYGCNYGTNTQGSTQQHQHKVLKVAHKLNSGIVLKRLVQKLQQFTAETLVGASGRKSTPAGR